MQRWIKGKNSSENLFLLSDGLNLSVKNTFFIPSTRCSIIKQTAVIQVQNSKLFESCEMSWCLWLNMLGSSAE